jgi:hypothetical protein
MHTLWIIWFVSLLLAVVLIGLSMRRVPKEAIDAASGITVGDIIRTEADIVRDLLSRWYACIRPIAQKKTSAALLVVRRWLLRVTSHIDKRIYGKGDIEEGRSASFFVKRIREFKDQLTRDELR